MFQFEHYEYRFLLPVALFLGGTLTVQLLWRRHRVLREIPGFAARCFSLPFEMFRGLLLTVALTVAIAAALGPREKVVEKIPIKKGMVVITGLDCSMSMLAPARARKPDEEGQLPTRLDIVRASVDHLFRALPHDKKGFVCFAQNVFASKTASTDYERVIKPQLDKIDPLYITTVGSGTNFAAAIHGCYDLFDTDAEQRNVCIILSDGEPNGDQERLDESLAAAVEEVQTKLKNRRMRATFYLVGVGDPEQKMTIPRFDSLGNFIGYLTTEEGVPVKTQPDERYLRDIAHEMHGTFVHIDTPDDLGDTLREIINNERKLVSYRTNVVFQDASPKYTVALLAVLFLWFFIPKRIFMKRRQ